jgi:hypothetical protein
MSPCAADRRRRRSRPRGDAGLDDRGIRRFLDPVVEGDDAARAACGLPAAGQVPESFGPRTVSSDESAAFDCRPEHRAATMEAIANNAFACVVKRFERACPPRSPGYALVGPSPLWCLPPREPEAAASASYFISAASRIN